MAASSHGRAGGGEVLLRWRPEHGQCVLTLPGEADAIRKVVPGVAPALILAVEAECPA